ncbi:MAG TPA: hypothetical protein VNO70_05890, partial [Blastocatellia bacterium]|nr:hypothetical protein [Blastocatellia bacterium]
NNFPIGQFYQIHADNRLPFYWVSGGLQDNGSWTGPSRTREPAGILNDHWVMVSFGDGFYMLNHADDSNLYLSEAQGGSIVRTDFRTLEQQAVSPQASRGRGPASTVKVRFNWNSPIVVSPHDKNTVYFGGSVLFKSTDFGKTWEQISNDLTTNDPEKQKDAGGPIATENTTAEYHCTIISVAESPAQRGMIWVGTDDGNVQLTTDGGKNWNNLTANVKGIAPNSVVSHVEPSRTSAGLAYVSFDRHMFDDFRPYIFKTTDSGRTWTNISGNLPDKAYVWVVREDPKNPNLIYAGTELGLFASYNGGTNWVPLNLKNLPTVAVHDIIIHPRENDIILATHGRSIWIFDDATPIQQMSGGILDSDAHLFDIRPALRFTSRFTRYGLGDKVFTGPNPPYGALITYYLKNKLDEKAKAEIQVLDESGKVIRKIEKISRDEGLNRVAWDLRYDGPQLRRPPSAEETSFFGGPRGPQVLPGNYTVKLMIGDKTLEKRVQVRLDPTVTVTEVELKEQFDHTLKLRDMQTAANNALRSLDSIKQQIEQIEKTVKDRLPNAPADLTKALSEHGKQVEALQGKLSAPRRQELGFSGRAQVADMLGGLMSAIDGVNAAPTPAQKAYFKELQTELNERMSEVNKFITQTVPQLNEVLRKHDAPTVIPGKAVEMP